MCKKLHVVFQIVKGLNVISQIYISMTSRSAENVCVAVKVA